MRSKRFFCEHARARGRDHCRACELTRAEARRRMIVALYEDGASIAHIARAVGTSRGSIDVELWRLRHQGLVGRRQQRLNTTGLALNIGSNE